MDEFIENIKPNDNRQLSLILKPAKYVETALRYKKKKKEINLSKMNIWFTIWRRVKIYTEHRARTSPIEHITVPRKIPPNYY